MKDKKVFIPHIDLNEKNQIKGYHILEGIIKSEINSEEVVLHVKMPDSKYNEISYKKVNLCFDIDSADQKLFDLQTDLRLKKIKHNFPTQLLPEKIKQLSEGYFSGNPLRFGEPNIGYVAQSNTFGKFENSQKIIQTIGAIDEDIETLYSVLDFLYLTNDYTKKLLGKYLIIELNSIFTLLKKLTVFDENYRLNYFLKMEMEIIQLENKYGFKVIRDKIAAHRDINVDIMHSVSNWRKITRYNITKYIDLIHDHLDRFLTEHYPIEKKQYFLLRKFPVGTKLTTPIEKDYKRFDNIVLE